MRYVDVVRALVVDWLQLVCQVEHIGWQVAAVEFHFVDLADFVAKTIFGSEKQ